MSSRKELRRTSNNFSILVALIGLWIAPPVARSSHYDVVVYGGTSAGIIAAIEADRHGKSVVIVSPTKRLGGLTTGGLGQTDIGSKAAIGGLSLEFYRRVAKHYADDANWKWQQRSEYRDRGQTRTAAGETAMWTFEPSAALKIFEDWLATTDIKIVRSARLIRSTGVQLNSGWIESISTEDGNTFSGKVFIDATYEGDLMAAAGVTYTVGRESNQKYGETLNGVQTKQAKHHQLVTGVDPYVVPGDPSSGLLPGVQANESGKAPGKEGSGDHRLQGFCFRMCLTDHPENRIPFQKPADYDERNYELLFRNYERGGESIGLPWINSPMPNRKTDTNNRTGVSTDYIGANYEYAEAGYRKRARIVAAHRSYQQGLMWTLANHPRIPAYVRDVVSQWGTCKDEFAADDGWQQQLYIREARRMVSEYVHTEQDCYRERVAADSVGMGAYNMDSHHVQRYVDEHGHVRNEGDVQVSPRGPYVISFRSIVPTMIEARNLVVPVCVSSSHIAFGSIRMEPVFMVLGHSAGAIASLAIDQRTPVQIVPYERLRELLISEGQVLELQAGGGAVDWPVSKFPGQVVDQAAAQLKGDWKASTLIHPFVGPNYQHDNNAGKGERSAVFRTKIPADGKYEIRLAYSSDGTPQRSNRATNVPVSITHQDGKSQITVNQQLPPPTAPCWTSLGEFFYRAGDNATVEISNTGTDGYVIIDAVQWLPVSSH